MKKKVVRHGDLEVYRKAMDNAMCVFTLTRAFPKEERYSLTAQVLRSSRSVCANLAEAWRKRRYEAAFVSKLSDAEAEAAETQVWIEFAVKCGFLERSQARTLYKTYDEILRMLVAMIMNPGVWILPPRRR